MSHVLKKKGIVGKMVTGRYSLKHQKIARLHSGNSILAKKGLRKIEKEISKDGTENNKNS